MCVCDVKTSPHRCLFAGYTLIHWATCRHIHICPCRKHPCLKHVVHTGSPSYQSVFRAFCNISQHFFGRPSIIAPLKDTPLRRNVLAKGVASVHFPHRALFPPACFAICWFNFTPVLVLYTSLQRNSHTRCRLQ